MTIDDLSARLLAMFPRTPIARVDLDDPRATWSVYDERADLERLEGKTWDEIDPEFILRHESLLTFAGVSIFRTLLPAYLSYLIHHPAYNEVPFHVAGQLTRQSEPDARMHFDERIAPLSLAQRTVVRDVLAHLITIDPMQGAMVAPLDTWIALVKEDKR